MSIFGTEESRLENIHNIALLISRIEMFMQYNPIKEKKASERFDVIAEQIRLLIQMSILSKWAKIVCKHKSGKYTITIKNFLRISLVPKRLVKPICCHQFPRTQL